MSLTTQTEWSIFDAETCSIPSFCYFQKNPLLNDLQISTWSKPSWTILRQLKNKFIKVILGGRVFLHIGHSIAQYEGKLSTDSETGNFSSPTNLPIVVLPFLGSFNSPAESFFNMVWLKDRRVVHNQGQWDFNPNSFDVFFLVSLQMEQFLRSDHQVKIGATAAKQSSAPGAVKAW